MRLFIIRLDSRLQKLVGTFPDWLSPIMHCLSFIGRPPFTIATAIGIGVIGLVFSSFNITLAAIVAGVTFGLNSLIKALVHRARPDGYTAEKVLLPTYSFPSGHAASSVVIFGLAAWLLLATLAVPWNTIVTAVLMIAVIGIGVSRVYLSAHWPTDVIAGWIIGLLGLLPIVLWVLPL